MVTENSKVDARVMEDRMIADAKWKNKKIPRKTAEFRECHLRLLRC